MYKLRLKKEDGIEILEMELEGVVIAKSPIKFCDNRDEMLKWMETNGFNVNKEDSPYIFMPLCGPWFTYVLSKYVNDRSDLIPLIVGNTLNNFITKIIQDDLNVRLYFIVNKMAEDIDKLLAGEDLEYNIAVSTMSGTENEVVEFRSIKDIVKCIKLYLK